MANNGASRQRRNAPAAPKKLCVLCTAIGCFCNFQAHILSVTICPTWLVGVAGTHETKQLSRHSRTFKFCGTCCKKYTWPLEKSLIGRILSRRKERIGNLAVQQRIIISFMIHIPHRKRFVTNVAPKNSSFSSLDRFLQKYTMRWVSKCMHCKSLRHNVTHHDVLRIHYRISEPLLCSVKASLVIAALEEAKRRQDEQMNVYMCMGDPLICVFVLAEGKVMYAPDCRHQSTADGRVAPT